MPKFSIVFLFLISLSVFCSELENYYEILGVSKDATPTQLRKAYKTLVMKYHPDKVQASQEEKDKATEIFNLVQKAYETLSDPDQKQIYEEFGQSNMNTREQWEEYQKKHGKKTASDFYTNSDIVIQVTAQNFHQLIKEPIIIEFYAPWCVHCQQMVKEYKKAATLLEGQIKVGALNCQKHEIICREQMIPQFPYIKYFSGQDTEIYQNQHQETSLKIYEWAIETQASLKKSIYINERIFRQEVLDGKEGWIIVFTAGNWCQPCTMIYPVVRKMQRTFKNMNNLVKVAAVHCDDYKALCQQQQVQFYPYVKVYNYGSKAANPQGLHITFDFQTLQMNPHNYQLDYIGDLFTKLFPKGTLNLVEKEQQNQQQNEEKKDDL